MRDKSSNAKFSCVPSAIPDSACFEDNVPHFTDYSEAFTLVLTPPKCPSQPLAAKKFESFIPCLAPVSNKTCLNFSNDIVGDGELCPQEEFRYSKEPYLLLAVEDVYERSRHTYYKLKAQRLSNDEIVTMRLRRDVFSVRCKKACKWISDKMRGKQPRTEQVIEKNHCHKIKENITKVPMFSFWYDDYEWVIDEVVELISSPQVNNLAYIFECRKKMADCFSKRFAINVDDLKRMSSTLYNWIEDELDVPLTMVSDEVFAASQLLVLLALYSLYNYSKLYLRRKIGDVPGPFQIILPDTYLMMGIGNFLPEKLFGFTFLPVRFTPHKKDAYTKFFEPFHSDIVALKGPFDTALLVASPDAVKQIVSNRVAFPKQLDIWKPTNVYGPHIASTENEDWKVHRKIAAPSFSERNNILVHEQTVKFGQDMIKEWSLIDKENGNRGAVVDIASMVTKVTLHITAAAAFGIDIDWFDPDRVPAGHIIPFKKALLIASSKIFERFAFPDIIRKTIPLKYFQEIETGYSDFNKYLEEILADAFEKAKNPNAHAHADLINSLVTASVGDGVNAPILTREELKGDAFAFLVAGHETTAHALSYAFGLLALYPDVQAKMFNNVNEVLEGRLPDYSDLPKLSYVLAVFEEALRMYPPGLLIPKITGEDVELDGYEIKANTRVYIDVRSLHFNPKFWEIPNEFYPERFLKGNREKLHSHAFLPFSEGARGCIGRRFALAEAVCLLAMVIQKYKIEPAKQGVKEEELLDSTLALTLTPKGEINLLFKAR